ncbi:phosphoribosyltransferase [Actinomadura monticuli]|uniref:Phosphoribosyltransferase family protein n=1 Tax=Actinomadura monticuli TaxID=3097367 RepID=A0ABV4QK24_9ACTN
MNDMARRVFEHRAVWRLTLPAYQAGVELLAEAALARLGGIGAIVGIANGGRAPASAIAGKVGAPAVAVTARHNPDDTTYCQATGQVQCDFASFIPLMGSPGPFLVVDDICGTGATLAAVVEILTWLTEPEAKICTATLCRNVGAPPGTPDLHVWSVADWVVFPWEPDHPDEHDRTLPVPTEVNSS